MAYEITIKETTTKTVTKNGAWTVVDTQPWDPASLSEAMSNAYGGGGKQEFLKNCPLHEIRGYAPSYETSEKVEKEVFRQTVEDLDMTAVICAINLIKQP